MKKAISYLAGLAIMVISCTTPEEPQPVIIPELTIEQRSYTVDAEGGIINVEVKSNVTVSAEIPEAYAGWISALSSGDDRFSFSIALNEDRTSRTGTISFKAGELSETVTVTQAEHQPVAGFYQFQGVNWKYSDNTDQLLVRRNGQVAGIQAGYIFAMTKPSSSAFAVLCLNTTSFKPVTGSKYNGRLLQNINPGQPAAQDVSLQVSEISGDFVILTDQTDPAQYIILKQM